MTQEEIKQKIYRKIEDPEEIKKLAKKMLIILQNEIWPREKKYDVKIDGNLVSFFVRMEFEVIINRKELRMIMEDLFKAKVEEVFPKNNA